MLRTAAVAIVSLYALYVVAINVFLSTSLFERTINGDPETLLITFERGWSVVPGRVHARNLSIRSSDSHVQWILRIEKVAFRVSFYDLALKKKFHASDVDGSGVTFQGRQRFEAPALTPEYLAAIPVVPGFEALPVRPLDLPNLLERFDDRHWHLWTVELEDVIAEDVRLIWVDNMRFDGQARIAGGFYLKPIREVRIGPIHADLRAGRTTVGLRTVLDPITGAFDFRVTSWDPRVGGLPELLQRMSLSTELHGRVPDLANLPPSMTGPGKLAGPVDLRRLAVRIENGKLASGTHADLFAPGASVEIARHRFAGQLGLVADVTPAAGPPRLTFHVDARAITGQRFGTDAPLFRAESFLVDGDAAALDLAADPFRDLHVVGDLPAGELPDARLLGGYVPPSSRLGLEGGRVWAHARLEAWLADHRAKGNVGLAADDLDLRIAKARVTGSTVIEASVDAWRWDTNMLEGANATLHVGRGGLASQRAPAKNLLAVHGLDIALEAASLDLNDPLRQLSAKVTVPEAEIVDRGLLRQYLPKGQEMQIAKGHAKFDARCELDVIDHRAKGTVDVHSTRLGFTLRDLAVLADVHAHARVHDWAWERGHLALDLARIQLDQVSATTVGAKQAALTIPRVVFEMKSDRFAVSDPLANVVMKGSIAGGRVTDPAAIDAFLPADSELQVDVSPSDARFSAQLDATIVRHVARGKLDARAHGIGVRSKKIGVRGDITVTADIAKWHLDESRISLNSSRVTVDDVEVRVGTAKATNGGKDGDDGAPDLRAKHVELQAKVEDVELAHPTLRGGYYRVILDGAEMEDARRLNDLLPPGDGFAFHVESGKARASADVSVTAGKGVAGGGVRIAIEGGGVRFHETRLGGDFEVAVDVKRFDREKDSIDISGTRIAMRNVHAVGASAETTAWNGDVNLLQGAVRVSERPGFDGFVQIHVDNANPVLAILLRKSLPKFVVGMMKAPDLSGQARLMIEDGRTAIRDAHLRGGDVVLMGDYVVVGDHRRGAMTVAMGPLSAGIKLDDQGTFVRLWGLEGWQQEEKRRVAELFATGDAENKGNAKAKAAAAPSK